MPCVYNSPAAYWTGLPTSEADSAETFGIFYMKPRDPNEFVPPVDVFDTPEAFILHASLPGAKREDIGVDFDPDLSEIHISGVVHRDADEELLKKLVIKGRDVGVFKRKYRLGARRQPASVDVGHITAKLENGILTVILPKHEKPSAERTKIQID